jgi:hypothetical protein
VSDNHDISIPVSHKVSDSPATKSCGGCTACCTIMSVEAVNKPTYTPCQHICQQGCSIYSEKPSECSVWECAWKSGWIDGDERRRPDQLGVMFEFRVVGGKSFLWVYEVWPDAFNGTKVQYLLARLEKKELLVRCKYGSMRVESRPEIIDYLKRNGVGSQDVPLVPLQLLVDENGKVVGKLITERVGNEFIRTIRERQMSEEKLLGQENQL